MDGSSKYWTRFILHFGRIYWSLYFHRFRLIFIWYLVRVHQFHFEHTCTWCFCCQRKISLVSDPSICCNVNAYLWYACYFARCCCCCCVAVFFHEMYQVTCYSDGIQVSNMSAIVSVFFNAMQWEANGKNETVLAFSYNHLTTAHYSLCAEQQKSACIFSRGTGNTKVRMNL